MKTEGKTRTRGILIVLAAICLAVWLACGAAVFFADSPAFAMGMAGMDLAFTHAQEMRILY